MSFSFFLGFSLTKEKELKYECSFDKILPVKQDCSWPCFTQQALLCNVRHLGYPRGAQYVTLQKHFTRPSLAFYFCGTPPYKTKIVTANGWEATNSKPPGPIIIFGQSEKQGPSGKSYLLHSFLAGAQRWLPFSSLSKLYKYACSKNHFPQPKRHVLTFLHPILLCRAPYWGPLGMLRKLLWAGRSETLLSS